MTKYKTRWPKYIPHDSATWTEVADLIESGKENFICNTLQYDLRKSTDIEHLHPIAVERFGAFKNHKGVWWLLSQRQQRVAFCRAVAKIQKIQRTTKQRII